MPPVTVPNRPFATDRITGLMLPDGIFVAAPPTGWPQRLNAQFTNSGAATAAESRIYVESASDPSIVVTPNTYNVVGLAGGASRVLTWDIDVGAATPGAHQISFIAENDAGRTRTIKKIFITRVQFDVVTKTFSADVAEGRIAVRFRDLVTPPEPCCLPPATGHVEPNFLGEIGRLFRGHDLDFAFCPPGFLLHNLAIVVTPAPAFSGQFGDLPFQDPWWKVLLCILAFLALVGAAIAGGSGGGRIVITTGGAPPPGAPPNPCRIRAEGGSSSYVVAGLVAAAAGLAELAAATDVRDPFRRGEDSTVPAAGELTTEELLEFTLGYADPIVPGKPFAVGANWEYTRVTTGASATFAVNEVNANIHVLSGYQVTAPEVVRRYLNEAFVVHAKFLDPNGRAFRGEELFVQCVLAGPNGEFISFVMQDDGILPDETARDGTYTGSLLFPPATGTVAPPGKDPRGVWLYYVIAQDVNRAQPSMSPEEAARIIGGMVLTGQLAITFQGGDCPLAADGHFTLI